MLLVEKVTILDEYSDFANVFLKESVAELPKPSNINKHIINLELDKRTLHRPIYSLRLIELKILTIYIETNLANNFIQLSKFSIKALILFIKKHDGSFYFYVDYYSLNNLTIKK